LVFCQGRIFQQLIGNTTGEQNTAENVTEISRLPPSENPFTFCVEGAGKASLPLGAGLAKTIDDLSIIFGLFQTFILAYLPLPWREGALEIHYLPLLAKGDVIHSSLSLVRERWELVSYVGGERKFATSLTSEEAYPQVRHTLHLVSTSNIARHHLVSTSHLARQRLKTGEEKCTQQGRHCTKTGEADNSKIVRELEVPSRALPCIALPCLALPCIALPCLALRCLALHCVALPTTTKRGRGASYTNRGRAGGMGTHYHWGERGG